MNNWKTRKTVWHESRQFASQADVNWKDVSDALFPIFSNLKRIQEDINNEIILYRFFSIRGGENSFVYM